MSAVAGMFFISFVFFLGSIFLFSMKRLTRKEEVRHGTNMADSK